jgi:hypothetical protein
VDVAVDADLVEQLRGDAAVVGESGAPAGHDPVGLGVDDHLPGDPCVAETLDLCVVVSPGRVGHAGIK